MNHKSSIVALGAVFLSALGCAFIMYMLNAFHSLYLSSFACSTVFFWLTWEWLKRTDRKRISCWIIVATVIVGRIILELPLRIIDFSETRISLLDPVCSIVAIVMAVVCYKRQNLRMGIMAFVVLLLLNSICQYLWVSATDEYLISCMVTVICVGTTWLCLMKSKRLWVVTCALCLGCLLVATPFFLYSISTSIWWIPVLVCALSAIVLTTVCFQEQRQVVWLLSFIILLLLNSFGQYVWLHTSLFIAQ